MIGVREAIDHILAGVPVLDVEDASLLDARGRVLAEEVDSPLDLPAHPNSAMDGYAVRAADVRGASQDAPRRLHVVESVPAGRFPTRAIGAGEATRIFTGAPLPDGSDGVIRQEDTTREGDDVVVLYDRDAGKNLRLAGEDLRKGARVFDSGAVLGPAQLGVLASMARSRVRVRKRARVAIIASGDEIVDLDQAEEILAGRKTATSNSYTLHALVLESGATPVPLGIAADTLESVRALFGRATRESDLIVSTAGVSVGEHDFVRDALAALGAELGFWRVRMRPGSPLGFATVAGVPWIGLPGNPVSTMVCFELYVRPAIRKMHGHRDLFRRTVPAVTEEPIKTGGRLTHFLRAVLTETDAGYRARLTGPQGSGILTSMAKANALLIVPEDRNEVPAGSTLSALLLDDSRSTEHPPLG
ncbi:MAG: molybdopterin molybdotransferase MoeA [Gemmatimonadales bacterium]|nr:molybdopterin molybdotransferase MoeA [Gemmatimonadales bacterium]